MRPAASKVFIPSSSFEPIGDALHHSDASANEPAPHPHNDGPDLPIVRHLGVFGGGFPWAAASLPDARFNERNPRFSEWPAAADALLDSGVPRPVINSNNRSEISVLNRAWLRRDGYTDAEIDAINAYCTQHSDAGEQNLTPVLITYRGKLTPVSATGAEAIQFVRGRRLRASELFNPTVYPLSSAQGLCFACCKFGVSTACKPSIRFAHMTGMANGCGYLNSHLLRNDLQTVGIESEHIPDRIELCSRCATIYRETLNTLRSQLRCKSGQIGVGRR